MKFDGPACVRLVRDRSTPEADLVAAIESLMFYPAKASCDALFDVLMDASFDDHIREEAAGSLGTLWIELGVDQTRIRLIPEALRAELTADFKAHGITVQSRP